MLSFKMFIEEKTPSSWENHFHKKGLSEFAAEIKKRYPNTNFKLHNDDNLSSHTWELHHGKPVVSFHEPTLRKELKLKPAMKEKAFHHPFYGTIPHEIEEAEVTKKLVDGKWDDVKKKYPEHKWKSKITKMAMDHQKTMTDEDKNHFHATGELKGRHGSLGGEAHEIITSKDRPGYHKFIDHLDNTINGNTK